MTQTASIERMIIFPSRGQPTYQLEGVLHVPQKVEAAPAIILCHPQPASSDMADNLTLLLAKRIASSQMVALRFNFRGVGKSQGQQTDGRLEALDLAGAVDAVLRQPGINPAKICVIGHGFGAYIALLYAPYDPRIHTVVAISLPLFRVASGFPRTFEGPRLFVTGEFDEVCPLYKLEPFVEQQQGRRGIKVVTGARHLMRDYEDVTITAIMKYVNEWAKSPENGQ